MPNHVYDLAIVSLETVIPIYLIIACGWMGRRLKWIEPQHEAPLMRLAVDLCMPCLIISSMVGNDLIRSPLFAIEASAAGFLGVMVGIAAAWVIAKSIKLKIGTGLRTFSLAAGVQNYSFFVIPLVAVMYPTPGNPMMGVLMTHNTGCELAVWTVGLIIMSGKGLKAVTPKIFLRGPIIAIVVGLLMVWTRADQYIMPAPILKTLTMLGNCTVPLCVLTFGTAMYDSWKEVSWTPKIIFSGIFSRLGLAPALMLGLAWILPVSPEIKQIIVIQAAIPSAIVPIILAKQFGGNPGLAVQVTLLTTVVSFFTLPLWLALGRSLFGV